MLKVANLHCAASYSVVLFCIIFLAACSESRAPAASSKLPRGYLPFENVKLGITEESVKRAIFSFAPDPKGRIGNKTQYLSRNADTYGGQYLVQCKDNQVYEVQVYHLAKPIPKDAALITLKNLLPADALAQAGPNAAPQIKPNTNSELYHFARTYTGELVYAGKTGGGVTVINAWFVPERKSTP